MRNQGHTEDLTGQSKARSKYRPAHEVTVPPNSICTRLPLGQGNKGSEQAESVVNPDMLTVMSQPRVYVHTLCISRQS